MHDDRQPPDLDTLEREALQAWREADELHEGSSTDGFVGAVMRRYEEEEEEDGRQEENTGMVDGQGLFLVEDAEAVSVPPAMRRWPRIASGRVAVATAAAALAGWMALDTLRAGSSPATDESVEVEVAASERQVDSMLPDRLGRPDLRRDGTPGAPLPEGMDEQIEDYIADYGRDWGPTFEFHGTVLVARDGEIKYARGFGTMDPSTGAENGVDSRYRLGMLTEQFTAVAILQLRDAGKLTLSDPVSAFLPDYPRGDEITIEHLLTHTSGIPNYTNLPYFHTWKNKRHTTEQLIDRFAKLDLEFAPGTDFSPTNSGYYLLGAIVEKVTGQSYGEYLRSQVLGPAQMTATTLGDAYETGGQARGHVWNDEEILDPPDPIDMTVFGAAGGLVSTATDLARWDHALYGGAIVSKASLADMIRPNEHGYGYGYVVSEAYGQPVVSFPGAIDGFNGHMLRFQHDHTLVVVLANTEVVPAMQIAEAVAMIVYGDEPPPRVEPHEVFIAPGTFEKYVGTYVMTDQTRDQYGAVVDPERFALMQTVHVRRYGDRLYFDVPGHGLSWMHPMGRNRFFFKDHAGTTLGFRLDGDEAETLTVHYKDAALRLRRHPPSG